MGMRELQQRGVAINLVNGHAAAWKLRVNTKHQIIFDVREILTGMPPVASTASHPKNLTKVDACHADVGPNSIDIPSQQCLDDSATSSRGYDLVHGTFVQMYPLQVESECLVLQRDRAVNPQVVQHSADPLAMCAHLGVNSDPLSFLMNSSQKSKFSCVSTWLPWSQHGGIILRTQGDDQGGCQGGSDRGGAEAECCDDRSRHRRVPNQNRRRSPPHGIRLVVRGRISGILDPRRISGHDWGITTWSATA